MPLYDYVCTDGHTFEDMSSVEDREHTECECGCPASQVILSAPILDPKMGVSTDFPTMAAKWDRKQRRKATGQIKDANQTRFGTNNDVERDAHRLRQGYES